MHEKRRAANPLFVMPFFLLCRMPHGVVQGLRLLRFACLRLFEQAPLHFEIDAGRQVVGRAHFQRVTHEIKGSLQYVADVVAAVGAVFEPAVPTAQPDFTDSAVSQMLVILQAAAAVNVLRLNCRIKLFAPEDSGLGPQLIIIVPGRDIGGAFCAVHAAAGNKLCHAILYHAGLIGLMGPDYFLYRIIIRRTSVIVHFKKLSSRCIIYEQVMRAI